MAANEMAILAVDMVHPTASTCELIAALNAMTPDAEAQMTIDFAELFPAAKSAKDRGIPTRQIVESLKRKWPDLHHATFRKLFNAELSTRNEFGERTCCMACGQPLTPKESAHLEASFREAAAIDTSKEAAA